MVVRVEPSGALIGVRQGETLMAAAERQGYRWPTICHGQAVCTACCIVLDNNLEAFEPAGAGPDTVPENPLTGHTPGDWQP